MKFVPLYYGNKLVTVNEKGFVGILTLWSRPRKILELLAKEGISLDPSLSPVAVLGTLYGNGLPHLLRNLLYNPQITHLLVCGRDRSSSFRELTRFFSHGVEPVEFLGTTAHRIRGTQAVIDDRLHPGLFRVPPEIQWVGSLTDPESLRKLRTYFDRLVPREAPSVTEADRREIPPGKVSVGHYPSCVLQHSIVEEKPLDAWKEVLFKLVRFGRKVELKKGVRKELQNLKVVVLDPSPDPEEELRKFGFRLEDLTRYQQEMLDPDLPDMLEYTYGHRLRTHFGVDTLRAAAERLRRDPESRHQFISLWDTAWDFKDRNANPCLVNLFFRLSEGRLNLTATYRTHNAIDAWLMNVYGLIRVLDYVCLHATLPKGALTVFSLSIGLDPANSVKYAAAVHTAEQRKHRLRTDPFGYFRVSVEDGEIVVRHGYGNLILREYRSRHAESLQHQLVRDDAVSDINHAFYLGRQLALAEAALKRGETFEEG